jgi:hypothetical protein
MGSLIPNPNDLEIVDQLNAVFTGTKLTNLRNFVQGANDDFFAPGRSLARISWRLNVFPTSGNKGKGRWLTFLKKILPGSVHDQILAQLRAAVGYPAAINNNCIGIRFWVVYHPKIKSSYELHVDPGAPDASGQYWVTITLKCKAEIDAKEPGDPTTPIADGGEQPPPQPPI